MNIFAYGTLINRTYLKAICGKTFPFKNAVLKNFKRYASDTGYPYVIPKENAEVEGVIYFDVDKESLEKIDKYESEGNLYYRTLVEVITEDGNKVEAYVYVANIKNMRRTFGDKINIHLVQRVEEFIHNKIGERIELLYQHHPSSPHHPKIELLAKTELLSAEIKELTNMYFNDEYVSNYTIDNELKFHGLPELPKMDGIPVKVYYRYIDFIFLNLVLNQLEEHIHKSLSHLIYSPDPYYERTFSLLTALRFINTRLYDLLIYFEEFLPEKKLKEITYLSLTEKAVITARELFLAHRQEIELMAIGIKRNLNPGVLSLGIEMEFSNLGYKTNKRNVPPEKDKVFHGFKYFHQFDLLRRLWKLGGHLDDHTHSEQEEKKGGFLEFAVGRESIYSHELSSPLTQSLFVCHAFISELIIFTNIKPHSIHIHIQNKKEIDWKKENNIELLKCLILIAGDFRKTKKNKIIERRIYNQEIIRDPCGYLRFISENRHLFHKNQISSVLEYQFPRLSMMKDYEAIIGAFKGFQVAYNPRPFGSKMKLIDHPLLIEESDLLENWANDVKPVSKNTVDAFLAYVEEGLFTENNGKAAHKKKYIEDILFKIEKELKSVNESISDPMRFMRKNQDIPYEKLARKFLVS